MKFLINSKYLRLSLKRWDKKYTPKTRFVLNPTTKAIFARLGRNSVILNLGKGYLK